MGQACSFCNPKDSANTTTKGGGAFEAFPNSENDGGGRGRDSSGASTQLGGSHGALSDAGAAGDSGAVNAQLGETGGEAENLLKQQRQRQAELEAEEERLRWQREEQARLDRIVSRAGKDMISVNRRATASASHLHHHHARGGMGGGVGGGEGPYFSHELSSVVAVAVENLTKSGLLSSIPLEGVDVSAESETSQGNTEENARRLFGGQVPATALKSSLSDIMDALSSEPWDGVHLRNRSGSGVGSGAGGGPENPLFFVDDCAEEFLASVLPLKEQFQNSSPIVESLP